MSPPGREVSVAPARLSAARRAGQEAGRAGARSGGLRAAACALVLELPGSTGHPAGSRPANRRPGQPQLLPPARSPAPRRGREGREGEGRGRTCLTNRPHLGNLAGPDWAGRSPSAPGTRPLCPFGPESKRATCPLSCTPELSRATRPPLPRPRRPTARAVSPRPPGPSVRRTALLTMPPGLRKIKPQL